MATTPAIGCPRYKPKIPSSPRLDGPLTTPAAQPPGSFEQIWSGGPAGSAIASVVLECHLFHLFALSVLGAPMPFQSYGSGAFLDFEPAPFPS